LASTFLSRFGSPRLSLLSNKINGHKKEKNKLCSWHLEQSFVRHHGYARARVC